MVLRLFVQNDVTQSLFHAFDFYVIKGYLCHKKEPRGPGMINHRSSSRTGRLFSFIFYYLLFYFFFSAIVCRNSQSPISRIRLTISMAPRAQS